MEGQVGLPEQAAPGALRSPSQKPAGSMARPRPAHLMCGAPLWGLAGAAVSAYFSYISYAHVAAQDYSWTHTGWTVFTYAVWIVVIAGLLTETRCGRERIFFSVVLLTFLIGFTFSAWSSAPETAVRQLRIVSAVLWALAALASLATLSGAKARA